MNEDKYLSPFNEAMMINRKYLSRQSLSISTFAVILFLLWYFTYNSCTNSDNKNFYKNPKTVFHENITYDHNLPIIFIGGFPRSGTTLMRAMLDAHPEVRCGEETRIIPRLLGMRRAWLHSKKEAKRLKEAGLNGYVLDSALRAFMLEIIVKHGPSAPRLCNKDPFTIKSGVYLSSLFPNAKFIFMVRDGRAAINSLILRSVTITGFDLDNPRECLEKWSNAANLMQKECQSLGTSRCLPVFYEQLVLHPKSWLKKILEFLELPWNDAVLHHQDYVDKPGGISLSKTEKSTDQVIKPVNTAALVKWVGKFPKDVVRDMADIAPMLQKLGYDPHANPPNYGNMF